MKKLIGTVVLAALVAGAAFADVNVGAGWNTGIWSPFLYDTSSKKVNMQLGTPWGGGCRVGFSVSAASDNMGISMAINTDGNGLAADGSFIWAQPWDFLKLQYGSWFDDTLRGCADFGIRSYNRLGLGGIAVHTFARIYGANYDGHMNGVLVALTPIEGLYIAAGLPVGNGAKTEAWKVFERGQYVVGYTIADTAAIKAQYIGSRTAIAESSAGYVDGKGTINAAVDLLMLEGMKISLGAFIPMVDKTPISIAATYNGSFDALGLNAFVVADIARADAGTNIIHVGVDVGYDLGDGLSFEGDVRFGMNLPKVGGVKSTSEITVGAFLSKGLSNGSIGIGVDADFSNIGGTGDVTTTIAIPIRITAGF